MDEFFGRVSRKTEAELYHALMSNIGLPNKEFALLVQQYGWTTEEASDMLVRRSNGKCLPKDA